MSGTQIVLAAAAGATFLYVMEGSRSTYDVASEQTPLARAARAGELDLVEQTLAEGADVNYRDELMGNTPLHWAVSIESEQAYPSRHRLAIVQALLRKGADPKLHNLSETSALHQAVWSPELVEALLKGGAPVDDGVGIRTPLDAATYYGGNLCFASAESMKLLLQAGAQVNAQEGSGWTTLVTAVLYGCPEMVETLLAAGADPNIKNQMGETLLATVRRVERYDAEGVFSFLTKPDPLVRKRSLELIRKAGGRE